MSILCFWLQCGRFSLKHLLSRKYLRNQKYSSIDMFEMVVLMVTDLIFVSCHTQLNGETKPLLRKVKTNQYFLTF